MRHVLPPALRPFYRRRPLLATCPVSRDHLRSYDWVLDLDIKSFFDEIDWDLLVRAVRRHTMNQMGRGST